MIDDFTKGATIDKRPNESEIRRIFE